MNQKRKTTSKKSATRWMVALFITLCTLGIPVHAAHSGVIGEKDTIIILFNTNGSVNDNFERLTTEASSVNTSNSFQAVDLSILQAQQFRTISEPATNLINVVNGVKTRRSAAPQLIQFNVNKYLLTETEEKYLNGKLSLPHLQ